MQGFNNPPAPAIMVPNHGVTCVLGKDLPDTMYQVGFGKTGSHVTIEYVLDGINIDDVYFQPDLHYDITLAHGNQTH